MFVRYVTHERPLVERKKYSNMPKNGADLNLKTVGAQERTRTFTSLRTLAPEASASTNFTTWAGGIKKIPDFESGSKRIRLELGFLAS